MTKPEPIEDAIAAAARSLVEADPSPALRARVLARLDETPRAVWRWWPAVAAAASLVVAVILGGRPLVPVRLPGVAHAAAWRDLSRLVVPSVDPSRLAWEGITATALAPSGAVAAVPELTPAEAAWFSAAVQPLAAPDLDVPAVTQPEPVSVPLLSVEALVTPPVFVRPLATDRDRRVP